LGLLFVHIGRTPLMEWSGRSCLPAIEAGNGANDEEQAIFDRGE
jgi:hypothetical protein